MFGNFQEVPKDIVANNVEFTLRVVFKLPSGEYAKIVGFYVEVEGYGKNRFSQNGELAIKLAIEAWNKKRIHLIR
ncbi:MAG: hypothetical protein HY506_01055 [Candidatus Yanofskybacteria bacterium]|nr:hypothetical protein [Candidatus Yanofskybacteria bacterium]